MKKLALLTVLVAAAALLNAGCAASGSIKPTSAVTPTNSVQVGYVAAPSK